MFGKRVNDLTAEDINRLITEQVRENEEIEFKETLPAKSGTDRWIGGSSSIGDYARDEILAEVIAFANAHGGTVVVGVAESLDKPSRADSIAPLPRCAELAERLRLQCRDCIDPQIPMLDVGAVEMASDHSGVVVIQVPQSRNRPHRHKPKLECYVRRADRTEKMTMREIQDLTLQAAHGWDAIEQRFASRRLTNLGTLGVHIRATLVPLAPIYLESVHKNDAVDPPLTSFKAVVGDGEQADLLIPVHAGGQRPILRATRHTWGEGDFSVQIEVHCDGLIEYLLFARPTYLALQEDKVFYPGWVMALFCNGLCAAERFRRAANAPEIEYGLEVEFLVETIETIHIAGHGRYHRAYRRGPLPRGQTLFPRYSVGAVHEWDKLMTLVYRDFWNTVGVDLSVPLAVDFEEAFKRLGLS